MASSYRMTNAQQPEEYLFKVLVIGEAGTGKTSFIKRYVHQFFTKHYKATIGIDFALKMFEWDEDTVVRLQLWDIAGQERFGNMTRVYYKDAVGAFLAFDVSRETTFEAISKWKADLDSKVSLADGSNIPCMLLANRCDVPREGIANQPEELDKYCREKGFVGWYYTSPRDNENVEESARHLVGEMLRRQRNLDNNIDPMPRKGAIQLERETYQQNTKGCCRS